MPCVNWIVGYLKGHRIESQLFFGETRDKANIYATVGPPDKGGILLSGHVDTVPAITSAWASDPFCLRQANSRVYGRGTSDMKGFLAIVLAAIPEMVDQPLRCPFHLAFSFDEELGCRGVPFLIAGLPKDARRPRVALVGEPTSWRLVDRHKGSFVISTTVNGKAAHSSRPELGVNAIAMAARLIDRIFSLAAEKQNASVEPGQKTVFNVGKIRGGEADNVVPAVCHFTWGFRTFYDDPDEIIATIQGFADRELLPLMRATSSETRISFTVERKIPPLDHSERIASFAKILGRCAGAEEPPIYVGYGTEAGHYAAAGIPALVCGPGDIAQAHQVDEWIAMEQLQKGDRVMSNLIAWARTHSPSEVLT